MSKIKDYIYVIILWTLIAIIVASILNLTNSFKVESHKDIIKELQKINKKLEQF